MNPPHNRVPGIDSASLVRRELHIVFTASLTLVDAGHEAEVARAALLRLPQVCVFLGVGIYHASVGEHNLPVFHHVTRKAVSVAVKRVLAQ